MTLTIIIFYHLCKISAQIIEFKIFASYEICKTLYSLYGTTPLIVNPWLFCVCCITSFVTPCIHFVADCVLPFVTGGLNLVPQPSVLECAYFAHTFQ